MTKAVPNQIWRERITAYAPLLFWIGFIFYLSSSSGSFSETSRFIGPLLSFLFPDAAPETLAQYHGYIRKLAHVAVYLVLGILAFRTCRSHFGVISTGVVLSAFGIVVAVASLDELNQSYNTVRTGTPWDVLLDAVGGIIGISAFGSWLRLRSH